MGQEKRVDGQREIIELGAPHAEAAAALWREAGLVRPWNDPEGDFLRAASGPTSAVLGVLGQDGSVLGTAMVGNDGHRGWVYYVAVDAGLRGSGLGAALMGAAEEWLRGSGAVKVQLMVRSTNAAVMGFYARLGYSDQHTAVLGKFLDPRLQAMHDAASAG